MNLASAMIQPDQRSNLATDISLVETSNGFKDIYRRNVGAVIMQRQPAPLFQPWIDALSPEYLPSLRVIVPVAKVAETIGGAFDSAQTPTGENRDYLMNDAVMLAKAFASLMSVSYLRIRFDVVNTNACRAFHLDQVLARLVCTYRGRGTQYGQIHPSKVPEQIFEVPTGSPILLRGARWDDGHRSGIVHRSPPIEGTGQTRLLFVLDPIKNPEAEY